ncbi:MAG: type II toxin-antitoxin system HicA family toxin [Desulfobacula sp.]|nr:type II toxin-antitoxin system HicA family toxin [Desulfobacula sp.]MBT3487822.1 type II toxin-antitoxin system HicA family toxin [Desulfobacula sp.]MBT3807476.1 type II toxin-antitoxin system HicA family toxin [Desulfobacula sp.]MBT4026562.1 type II toxin-antitoxin system HicA family toxin [Desulfobacula sp.]MBT4197910.1 type II toxin-antitoxin system HicA family toxin [Desulfobacula sp.]
MVKIKPTHYQVQIKIFEMAGCVYVRTKGDHLIYRYPGAVRPVIIPKYKEVPIFVIKNNMRVIEMSREKYLKFLERA